MKHVTNTVNRKLGLIYRSRNFLNSNILKTLHEFLIIPNLDYCEVVWGYACHKYISKLNKLHNRAGKTILRVNKRFPTDLMPPTCYATVLGSASWGSKTGVGTDLGVSWVLLLRWWGSCLECLSWGLLGVLLGPVANLLPFCDLSLFSILEIDMFVPSFCEFYQLLLNCGDWHFGL